MNKDNVLYDFGFYFQSNVIGESLNTVAVLCCEYFYIIFQGHFVECDSSNFVCAQEQGEAYFYGDLLTQLDLVMEQMDAPR